MKRTYFTLVAILAVAAIYFAEEADAQLTLATMTSTQTDFTSGDYLVGLQSDLSDEIKLAINAPIAALLSSDDDFEFATTWNDGGNLFTAIKLDVTDTASDTNSLLMDLRVASVSQFSITKAGNVTVGGTVDGRDIAADGAILDNTETTAELDARDTANRDRANHTGEQAISTVTGLQTALDSVDLTLNNDSTATFTDAAGGALSFREGVIERIGDNNFMLVHEVGYGSANILDPLNSRNINLGTHLSFIGQQAMPTIGSVTAFGISPIEYAVDDDYVGGDVIVCTIGGGYDNIVNSIASTITGGGHNFIKYTVGGHNWIGGGSWNLIEADRAVIPGGSANHIVETSSASVYSGIPNGFGNRIDGSDYTSAGGRSNTVTDGSYHHVYGNEHTVTGGVGVAVTGLRMTADDIAYASGTGADGILDADFSHTISRSQLSEPGDAQTMTMVMAQRTTNATIANLSPTVENFGDQVVSGFGEITLIGTRDGTANADNDYSQAAFQTDFGFFWDGLDGHFFKMGTETTVTSAPTLLLDEVAHTNNAFTPGLCRLAISTGLLRVQVTGLASTTINWVAKVELTYTRIAKP